MGKITVHPLNGGYLPLKGGKMAGGIDGIPDIVRTPEIGSNWAQYGYMAVNKRHVDGLRLDVEFLPDSIRSFAVVSATLNALSGLSGGFRAIVIRKTTDGIQGIKLSFIPGIEDYMAQRWRTAQVTFIFEDGTSIFLDDLTGTLSSYGASITYNCSVSPRSRIFGMHMVSMS